MVNGSPHAPFKTPRVCGGVCISPSGRRIVSGVVSRRVMARRAVEAEVMQLFHEENSVLK